MMILNKLTIKQESCYFSEITAARSSHDCAEVGVEPEHLLYYVPVRYCCNVHACRLQCRLG